MQEWRNWNTRLLQTQNPEGSTPSSCTLCPGGEILVNVHDSDSCARAGLRVRLPSWVFRCDATTGNGPVLKTGDPRKRTGGSSPSHSAMETWLNWQKHFPAKEGPGDRHVGSRPTVSAQMSPAGISRNFIPVVITHQNKIPLK